jgi:hypothetical protein
VRDDRWDHRGPEQKIARGTHFDVFNLRRDVGDIDPFTGR